MSVMPGRNGGTLRRGGNNTPGTGRPKSEVRAACAKGFDERISLLQGFADDPNLSPAERLKALDLLGKYGGLQQVDQTSDDKPMQTMVNFGGMSQAEREELLKNLTQ